MSAGHDWTPPQMVSGTLNTTSAVIYEETYAGGSNVINGALWSRNSTVTRTAVGRWTVAFNTPHLDGIDYHVSFSTHESGTFRDVQTFRILLSNAKRLSLVL